MKNKIFNEFASSQNTFFRNYANILPNPDTILQKSGKQISAYNNLKNDAHVWSCIQSRKSGSINSELTIQPNGASERSSLLLEQFLNNLDLEQIYRDILEAILFGYQPMEIYWKQSGEYIIPERIVAKPQDWFYFDLLGQIKYKSILEKKDELPPNYKIICPQHEASFNNPYGVALLSKCYWAVQFKSGSMRFWVTLAEKYGMPLLLGKYTRGATFEEAEKLANSLMELAQDAVIVTPSDIEIALHEPNRTSSVELFKELINLCNAEISKAILSQTLTTEMSGGSYAATSVHQEIRREIIASDIRLIESTINQVVKYIYEINFPREIFYPKVKLLADDLDYSQKLERDIRLTKDAGLKLNQNYWIKNYGYKAGDFE
ncbi:MAG: DUF935 family protein [Candidatus Kapabacteria bacterium]|nr:DUF935 family protein [Candidatus Kapabacteria bacterium]